MSAQQRCEGRRINDLREPLRPTPVDVKVRVTVDVRDWDATVAAIRETRRRFEKGAPPPRAAVELLSQLYDQLADSGPLELGHRWGDGAWALALEICQQAHQCAESGCSPKAARRVRSALATLEAFFADSRWWLWWWRSGSTVDKAMHMIYAPLTIPLLIVLWPLLALGGKGGARRRNVLSDPGSAAVSLELRGRLLFAAATDDRLIVTTDRGIVIARRETTGLRVECEISFRALIAKKTSDTNHLTVFTTDRSSSYAVDSADLVKILQLRAPDALARGRSTLRTSEA